MKVTKYFDVYPGMKLETLWLHDGSLEKGAGNTRYKIEIEVPDPEFDATATATVTPEGKNAK